MKHIAIIPEVGARIINYKPFQNFTKKDLKELREQIRLGSIYISDADNNKGLESEYCYDFFDAYLTYICNLAKEEGYDENDAAFLTDVYENFDTIENLVYFHKYEFEFGEVRYHFEIDYTRKDWYDYYTEVVEFAA